MSQRRESFSLTAVSFRDNSSNFSRCCSHKTRPFRKKNGQTSVRHLFRKRASSRGNFLRENHREHRVPAVVQRNDVIARHALTYVIFVALASPMKKIVKPRRDSFILRNIQRHQFPGKRASSLTAIRRSRFAVSLER